MICIQCGNNNQANTGFCPNCGATMKQDVPANWNGGQDIQTSAPPQHSTPVAAAATLVPICNRRSVLRNSLPWIGVLMGLAALGTTIQLLSRNSPTVSAASNTTEAKAPDASQQATPQTTPPTANEPAPPADQDSLSRLLKISDVSEFIAQPEVAATLKQVVGEDLPEFQRNLSVSGSPIIIGDTITFTTCAPQACGVSEAAVTVDTSAKTLAAAILANNHIRFYGLKATKLEECPVAMQKWAGKLAQGHQGDFTFEMKPVEPPAAPAPPSQN